MSVAGVALALFLAVFQTGMYFGYRRDTTSVLDLYQADLWIVPRSQTTFDAFARLDDEAYWRARRTAGIDGVSRVVWGDATWRLPASGGFDYAQILGLDPSSRVPMRSGVSDVARYLAPEGSIMICDADRPKLEVDISPDGPFEISGRRAFIVGHVDRVRLFSTAAFVLTDLDNARAFLDLPPRHVTYLACRCRPGVEVGRVIDSLRRAIPDHDVLAASDFRERCASYWMTNSGIGPVILASAVLGVIAGGLIVMFTFYMVIVDHRCVFACMKALGATTFDIARILLLQLTMVFVAGIALGSALLVPAVALVNDSSVAMEIKGGMIVASLGIVSTGLLGAGALALRPLRRLDPGEAFDA